MTPRPEEPPEHAHPTAPVRFLPGEADVPPADGVGLCLSGGGYRAMLFHAGTLLRLGEAGLLPRLDRVGGVSGGSLAAAALGLAWDALPADGDPQATGRVVRERVVAPLRALASETVDVGAVITGVALPFVSVAERAAAAYAAHLVGDATLRDLPGHPRIILCATSVQSGALFRCERAQLADHRVGRIADPELPLATALAASAAFPPVLSPLVLHLENAAWEDVPGQDLGTSAFRDEVVLTDGGVYDNLGLETVWKRCRTVLVSDAGGLLEPEEDPDRDWPRHVVRILKVIDGQVRDLRRSQVVDGLASGDRDGAFWAIRSRLANFPLADPLPCPPEATARLAEVPTRLAALDDELQERLVNWGYAACDAAVRAHVDPTVPAPTGFPYPAAAVG